jgi:ribosomal protein S18 acetylase RimI-like enzyme
MTQFEQTYRSCSSQEKNMNFIIRSANLEDYEELYAVFEEVDALHCEALPQVFQEPDGPVRSREYVTAIVSNENMVLFVAESDGQIIGLVQAYVQEAPDIPLFVPRRYAVIDNVAVKQDFRRSGIGQALIEKAERWAKDKKASQIELNVWEFNTGATAFYDKLGYETARRIMWKPLE